jgi:hypothetical protein
MGDQILVIGYKAFINLFFSAKRGHGLPGCSDHISSIFQGTFSWAQPVSWLLLVGLGCSNLYPGFQVIVSF